MHLLIANCRIVSPGVDLPNASIEISEGLIKQIYLPGDAVPNVEHRVDASGLLAVPGFIDIHTHGAGGGDACAADLDSLRRMARAKLSEGVTTFLPTTLTLPSEELEAIARTVAEYRKDAQFAQVPGIHLEGPFINPQCVGAQNPIYVRPPDLKELVRLQEICPIAILSMAVEMAGGMELVRSASRMGIVVSLAHTAATYAQFCEAKSAGLTHLTHFCNQMTPLHHREIGLVGAGLMDSDVRLELICDGLHLSADMIRLVFKSKSHFRLMLITDSIAASHQPDGNYTIGGLPLTVKQGAARLANGALAGSTLRMNDALRYVHELTHISLADLIATTSLNQAQSLGYDQLGRIAAGYAADIALLGENFEVVKTMVAGRPGV